MVVFGDTVIAAAKKQAKFLGFIVRIGRGAFRVLFLAGALLAAYAALKGIKVAGGSE
jgi:hypothetical protein